MDSEFEDNGMLTEIELEGLIQELGTELSEMFPGTEIFNHIKEMDGSIVVEVSTNEADMNDVEEELASKAAELTSEYEYEFIFVVRSDASGSSPDEA